MINGTNSASRYPESSSESDITKSSITKSPDNIREAEEQIRQTGNLQKRLGLLSQLSSLHKYNKEDSDSEFMNAPSEARPRPRPAERANSSTQSSKQVEYSQSQITPSDVDSKKSTTKYGEGLNKDWLKTRFWGRVGNDDQNERKSFIEAFAGLMIGCWNGCLPCFQETKKPLDQATVKAVELELIND